MKYYVQIHNKEIIGKANAKTIAQGISNIEVGAEVFADIKRYMYSDGSIVLNPNYEEEQAQAERERIQALKVTKRVFALALQQFGITYTQLKELIATNEQAQLEWDLCVELERSNPLLDVMALQMGITSDQLDYIFRKANGEEVDPPVVNNSDNTEDSNADVTTGTDAET